MTPGRSVHGLFRCSPFVPCLFRLCSPGENKRGPKGEQSDERDHMCVTTGTQREHDKNLKVLHKYHKRPSLYNTRESPCDHAYLPCKNVPSLSQPPAPYLGGRQGDPGRGRLKSPDIVPSGAPRVRPGKLFLIVSEWSPGGIPGVHRKRRDTWQGEPRNGCRRDTSRGLSFPCVPP